MSKRIDETDKELEAVLGSHKTRIRIVGTGGGGNNTITRLLEVGVKGVETIAINTDAQDLLFSKADRKVLIGKSITNGLGAGSDPKIGEESARESADDISNVLTDSDMIFITCGLGGGTGTGSAPVIAEIAKSTGALTIAVVTLPFSEEGIVRWDNARKGLDHLYKIVDTVIVVQNDRLIEMVPDLPLHAAFKVADEILVNAVKGITELVTEKGLVNLDFADVRTIMQKGGMAMIGLGESNSEENAQEAAEKALQNPLLEVDVTGARSALINITGGADMTLKSAKTVMQTVARRLDPSARIIWGARVDESLNHTLRVMLIVTSLKSAKQTTRELEVGQKKTEKPGATGTPLRSHPAGKPSEKKTAESGRPASAPKEEPVSTTPGAQKKKKASQVFSEIFMDESRADLCLLEEALKKLSTEKGADNDAPLREMKNAFTSLHNAAELFGFDHIQEMAALLLDVTQIVLDHEFDLSEDFLTDFQKVPGMLKGLINGEEAAEKLADEIAKRFSSILPFSPQGSQATAPEKPEKSLSPNQVKVSGFEVKMKTKESKESSQQATGENGNGRPSFSKVEEAVKFIDKLF